MVLPGTRLCFLRPESELEEELDSPELELETLLLESEESEDVLRPTYDQKNFEELLFNKKIGQKKGAKRENTK